MTDRLSGPLAEGYVLLEARSEAVAQSVGIDRHRMPRMDERLPAWEDIARRVVVGTGIDHEQLTDMIDARTATLIGQTVDPAMLSDVAPPLSAVIYGALLDAFLHGFFTRIAQERAGEA